ncbi:GspH/FimT family pseudopilin [uncultured Thiodictyon sp.]|uniref:GspH/FimT family pseudopilin n=1 Tax=uncultured Thiodictyon sp. TaxID=1846217 RepID=UPI0025F5A519|nr:GspH/FimT family pseudopilin [uncultured Thiodictyon sp.]
MSKTVSEGSRCGGGSPPSARPWRDFRGLTLIELIVTLSIVLILTVVAIPSFINMIRGNRLATQFNELVGDINLARSEAVKRGRDVKVCKKGGNGACGGGCWKNGWTVFVDADNSSTVNTGDIVIRQHGPFEGAPMVVDNGMGFLVYGSDGVAYKNAFGATNRTSTVSYRLEMYDKVCNKSEIGGSLQRLTIGNTGYAHVCRKGDTFANCTPDTNCLAIDSLSPCF